MASPRPLPPAGAAGAPVEAIEGTLALRAGMPGPVSMTRAWRAALPVAAGPAPCRPRACSGPRCRPDCAPARAALRHHPRTRTPGAASSASSMPRVLASACASAMPCASGALERQRLELLGVRRAAHCAPASAAARPDGWRAPPPPPSSARASARAASSGARSSSCSCTRTAVSGERSSCAASATNARCSANAACKPRQQAIERIDQRRDLLRQRRCRHGRQRVHIAPLHVGGDAPQRQQAAADHPDRGAAQQRQQQQQRNRRRAARRAAPAASRTRAGCAIWITPSSVCRPYTRQVSPCRSRFSKPSTARLTSGRPGRDR